MLPKIPLCFRRLVHHWLWSLKVWDRNKHILHSGDEDSPSTWANQLRWHSDHMIINEVCMSSLAWVQRIQTHSSSSICILCCVSFSLSPALTFSLSLAGWASESWGETDWVFDCSSDAICELHRPGFVFFLLSPLLKISPFKKGTENNNVLFLFYNLKKLL